MSNRSIFYHYEFRPSEDSDEAGLFKGVFGKKAN